MMQWRKYCGSGSTRNARSNDNNLPGQQKYLTAVRESKKHQESDIHDSGCKIVFRNLQDQKRRGQGGILFYA